MLISFMEPRAYPGLKYLGGQILKKIPPQRIFIYRDPLDIYLLGHILIDNKPEISISIKENWNP